MRVILNQDIPGTGKKWDIKEIKGGYARNYLLARNLAVLATDRAIKDAKIRQERENQKKILQDDLFGKTLESLKDFSVSIERKVNEKGHLYDALDIGEIAKLLEEKLKAEIPAEYIKLESSIKEIGKHKIKIQKGEKEVFFEIEVKAEVLH